MYSDQKKDRKVVAWLPLGIMLPVIAMDLPWASAPPRLELDGPPLP